MIQGKISRPTWAIRTIDSRLSGESASLYPSLPPKSEVEVALLQREELGLHDRRVDAEAQGRRLPVARRGRHLPLADELRRGDRERLVARRRAEPIGRLGLGAEDRIVGEPPRRVVGQAHVLARLVVPALRRGPRQVGDGLVHEVEEGPVGERELVPGGARLGLGTARERGRPEQDAPRLRPAEGPLDERGGAVGVGEQRPRPAPSGGLTAQCWKTGTADSTASSSFG